MIAVLLDPMVPDPPMCPTPNAPWSAVTPMTCPDLSPVRPRSGVGLPEAEIDVWHSQNRKGREHKCLSVGPLLEDARSATSQLEGRVYLTRSPQESKNLGICIHSTIRRQRQATLPDYRDMKSGPGTLRRSATAQEGNYLECGRLIRATGARHLGGCYVAGGKASTRPGGGEGKSVWNVEIGHGTNMREGRFFSPCVVGEDPCDETMRR